MNCRYNPAQRRYMGRIAFCMAYYFFVLIVVVWCFHHLHPAGWFAYTLAASPALAIAAITAAFGLYMAEEKDEFQVALIVKGLLGGVGATLFFVSIRGFLEDFAHLRHMDLVLVFPLFCFFFVLSYLVVWMRHR